MVIAHYYRVSDIFDDNGDPRGLSGQTNISLLRSFYHSRCNDAGDYIKMLSDPDKTEDEIFKANAGAVQLYHKDCVTLYKIPGHEDKEYKAESKRFDKYGKSTYGHVERILMKDVLDDLMGAYNDGGQLRHPSDPEKFPGPNNPFEDNKGKERKILKRLTEEASQYKEYLERKNIIVKMWSERPPCRIDYFDGKECSKFLENIFPEGSKFGYLTTASGEESEKIVSKVFKKFNEAYRKYTQHN